MDNQMPDTNELIRSITDINTDINTTSIKQDIELLIKDNGLYSTDFNFANHDELELMRPLVNNYIVTDVKLVTRSVLKEQILAIKTALAAQSTILGDVRLKLLSQIEEYRWLDDTIKQIDRLIKPTLLVPYVPPILSISSVQPVPPHVPLPVPLGASQYSIYVDQILQTQINHINQIDIMNNKMPSYSYTGHFQVDIHAVYNLFVDCKNNFYQSYREYINAVINYINLLTTNKYIERLLFLRLQTHPEEAEHC
jgi:hypothetical protein